MKREQSSLFRLYVAFRESQLGLACLMNAKPDSQSIAGLLLHRFSEEPHAISTMRILLVEDQTDLHRIIREMLEEDGYSVDSLTMEFRPGKGHDL